MYRSYVEFGSRCFSLILNSSAPFLSLSFNHPCPSSSGAPAAGRVRFAFLAPDEGVLNVWVADGVDVKAPERAKPLTKDRGRGVRAYFWADDGRSLASSISTLNIF